MILPATDQVALLSAARRKCLGGLDRADQTRAKVERTNRRMFITLVLIDRARRRLARQPARDQA
jgi:hypothetical protein